MRIGIGKAIRILDDACAVIHNDENLIKLTEWSVACDNENILTLRFDGGFTLNYSRKNNKSIKISGNNMYLKPDGQAETDELVLLFTADLSKMIT